jgi:hypothetical protein
MSQQVENLLNEIEGKSPSEFPEKTEDNLISYLNLPDRTLANRCAAILRTHFLESAYEKIVLKTNHSLKPFSISAYKALFSLNLEESDWLKIANENRNKQLAQLVKTMFTKEEILGFYPAGIIRTLAKPLAKEFSILQDEIIFNCDLPEPDDSRTFYYMLGESFEYLEPYWEKENVTKLADILVRNARYDHWTEQNMKGALLALSKTNKNCADFLKKLT